MTVESRPTSGLLARNNFWLARHSPRMEHNIAMQLSKNGTRDVATIKSRRLRFGRGYRNSLTHYDSEPEDYTVETRGCGGVSNQPAELERHLEMLVSSLDSQLALLCVLKHQSQLGQRELGRKVPIDGDQNVSFMQARLRCGRIVGYRFDLESFIVRSG